MPGKKLISVFRNLNFKLGLLFQLRLKGTGYI